MNTMQGKVAMITGASVGIGRAVALRLAEEGARLVLMDMNDETLQKTVAEVEEIGGECLAFTCDVSIEESVNGCVEKAIGKFG